MEKFYLEEPSIERKKEAIEYIDEHYKYNSKIFGVGGLKNYLDNYEEWLKKIENDFKVPITEERVPQKTYFLIRKNDNKIVGMVNIRLALNKKLSKHSGHIGYGIRPTERGKGYNKINLYLALKVCDEHKINKVFLDAALENQASWRTMESLGGKRIKEYYDDELSHCIKVNYNIDVKDTIEKYKDIYEPHIYK